MIIVSVVGMRALGSSCVVIVMGKWTNWTYYTVQWCVCSIHRMSDILAELTLASTFVYLFLTYLLHSFQVL